MGTTVVHKKDHLYIALILLVPWKEESIDPPLEYLSVEPRKGGSVKENHFGTFDFPMAESGHFSNRGRTHHQCHSCLVLSLISSIDILLLFLVDAQGVWELLV